MSQLKASVAVSRHLGAVQISAITGLVALMGASPAWSATSGKDILVRIDNENALSGAAPEWIKTIDSRQGLLKMHFRTEEDALDAKTQIENKGQGEVIPDLFYRPALVRQFKQVTQALGETFDADFLALPFAKAVKKPVAPPVENLPNVNPAPMDVRPGADPLAPQDWALKAIDMPQQLLSANAPITVAVIDTGVDYNHEDLSGAMWRNPQNPSEVGYDFAHNTDKPYDVKYFDVVGCMKDKTCYQDGTSQEDYMTNPGHGTHCAGHVGAVANNSLGIRGIGGGVANVMALKFFFDHGEQGEGQGDDAASIQAIDFAIQNGAKVISASWGGYEKRAVANKSALKAAFQRAQQAGVIIVVAAGNGDPSTGLGVNQDTIAAPSFPAAYSFDNMIVVAATDPNDGLTTFSNFGNKSVHIGAPGLKILSTTVGSQYQDVIATAVGPNGKTVEMDWDGTSMATPIVAGAVALVWSQHPDENYQAIRARILNTARKVPGLAGKVSSGGVLDVIAALNAN